MKKHKLKRYTKSGGAMAQLKDGGFYRVKDVEKMFDKLRSIALDPECPTDEANAIWDVVGTEGLDDS